MAPRRAVADADTVTVDMAVAWDNLYVSEGRDNLDGESLAGTTVDASIGGIGLGVWYAASPDTDYREVQYCMSRKIEWRDIEAYASFTHLRFLLPCAWLQAGSMRLFNHSAIND